MQTHSDPNYLIRLQNMRIGGDESQNRRSHSLNGSIGGVESTATKDPGNGYNHAHGPIHATNDYKLYDRNNIISASKLSNSKLNQNFVVPQTTLAKGYIGGYIVNNSPTHSLSGSSQHSGSPRTSLNIGGSNHLVYDQRITSAPVYENIDYYGTTVARPQQPSHHHHPPLYTSHYSGPVPASFDTGNKKAEPQVSSASLGLGRFTHTPQPPDVIESATPIYENVLSVTGMLVYRLFL